jgi:hypothetical protein
MKKLIVLVFALISITGYSQMRKLEEKLPNGRPGKDYGYVNNNHFGRVFKIDLLKSYSNDSVVIINDTADMGSRNDLVDLNYGFYYLEEGVYNIDDIHYAVKEGFYILSIGNNKNIINKNNFEKFSVNYFLVNISSYIRKLKNNNIDVNNINFNDYPIKDEETRNY